MNSNEIINQYEGKQIGIVTWPFYRYSALIPEQLGGDLFVWLYLSLVILINEGKGLENKTYSEDIKMEVTQILKSKFLAVIDDQTLAKIIRNAEDTFVDKTGLKEEAFRYVETYENLFSDKLEIQYIYQDAITGEVLPFFGDTTYIEDSFNEDRISVRDGIKEPNKHSVQNAYKQYMRIKRFNSIEEDIEVELEDEYIDEDEETFLEDSFQQEQFDTKKEEKKSLKNYNVIFLKDKRALFNLDILVHVEDNTIIVQSPFNKLTDQWLNKCLAKGRNVSQELDAVISEYENTYLIAEQKITSFIEGHKSDFASSLKYCQTLYRIIDALDDNRIREYVVKLDAMYAEQNELFYFYCGKMLDRLVRKMQYPNKSTAEQRRSTTFDGFCNELDYVLDRTSIYYDRLLKSRNIYDNWVKKYKGRNGKEFISFKADIADIMLRSSLPESKIMYPDFLKDVFGLYSRRSKVDHDDDDAIDITIDQKEIDTLTKVVKVMFELI